MNLLLDTHAWLWFVGNDARISNVARLAIESPSNKKWVSIASLWEITIKESIGKLKLSDPVDVFLSRELQASMSIVSCDVIFDQYGVHRVW